MKTTFETTVSSPNLRPTGAESGHPLSSIDIADRRTCRGPLRIVHVVSSLLGGGMEHVVVRLALAQKRAGHDVSVIALRGGPLLETALRGGLPVFVPARQGRLTRICWAAAVTARLRPDIIHAHNPTSLHYAVLGKTVSRARLVMTDHAQTRGIVRIPTRREVRLTDAVAAVSQSTALQREGVDRPGTLSVIHNGVDPPAGRRPRVEARATLGLTSACVGIMVAGMDRVKGHDTLLRALVALTSLDMTVLVVGDGAERENTERLALDLGLGPERVRFLGFRSDVGDLLSAADFFVLPSRMEGFPIAILEAMAHGLPIVATPVGGVPELVTHGADGLLVPVDDPAALAAAMTRLADDPALRTRLGAAAAARVRQEFSFDAMTRKYEAVYLGVRRALRTVRASAS